MELSTGYQAAIQGCGFYPVPDSGYLRIAGPDQSAFLQRQTTNDMRAMGDHVALLNVLTSPTARILDVFTLLKEHDSLALLSLPGQPQATFRFLKSRIFFNDQVTVTDASQEWVQIDVMGPGAEALLQQAGGNLPLAGQWQEIVLGEIPVRLIHHQTVLGLGYRLVAPAQAFKHVEQALLTSGAVRIGPVEAEILRVELGRPAAGSELTDAYTPLETGLEKAISDSKGCYTGQEIIARQVTYDKVTQRLCGLRLKEAASPGDRVWSEEKNIGQVTSAALSPRLGPLALGILKRPHHQPGENLLVRRAWDDASAGIPAVVTALPFSITESSVGN